MLILPGRAALIASTRELSAGELDQLGQMLSYGPMPEIIASPPGSAFRVETVETDTFFITPRIVKS